MLRRLLSIASIVCLVLCVALMGLWVRSYYWSDLVLGRFGDRFGFQIASKTGRLVLPLWLENLAVFAPARTDKSTQASDGG
jgi:hypothetical protein